MEKNLRCTVCPWRGSWDEAEAAPRVTPSQIPPPMMDIQEAYEEKQLSAESVGGLHEPPCPSCGHHTVVVRRPPTLRPSVAT